MCGRFSLAINPEQLGTYMYDRLNILDMKNSIDVPRYNIAPGQDVLAVIHDRKEYRVGSLKWGFVPPYLKDSSKGLKMINARAETVDAKLSFKESFISKRCVIVADGFYEWDKKNGRKSPHRFTVNSGVFFMAGLYTRTILDSGEKLFTTVIITTEANALVSPYHDRMPVILEGEALSTWLDPTTKDITRLKACLTPYNEANMKEYAVSPLVNNALNDSKACIKPY